MTIEGLYDILKVWIQSGPCQQLGHKYEKIDKLSRPSLQYKVKHLFICSKCGKPLEVEFGIKAEKE